MNNQSFWRTYKELQKQPLPHLISIKPKHFWKSHSFELPTYNILEDRPKIKQFNNKTHSILTQLGISRTRLEKVHFMLQEVFHEEPKSNLRRVSQFEQMSTKQKRLNRIAPDTQVYQHSHTAGIIKKKKMIRLKNQYKFLQRIKKSRVVEQRSKSLQLKLPPKITHKRAKTFAEVPYDRLVILPIDHELQRKIAILIYKRKSVQLTFKRKTFILQPKMSIFLSKENLLKYQQTLSQKFRQQKTIEQDNESSGTSSPMASHKHIQFKRSVFKKIDTQDLQGKPLYTPRQHNEQTSNIIHRKTSYSVINQYILKKANRIITNKSPIVQITSPASLVDMNHLLIESRKMSSVQQQSTRLIQSKSTEHYKFIENAIQTNSSYQIKITNKLGQRIKTENVTNLPKKKSIDYFRKLKPYFS